MTDESTTKTNDPRPQDSREQDRSPASSGGQTSTSPSRLEQGDPPRRPLGDRGTGTSQGSDESESDQDEDTRPGTRMDEGGGAFDSGARAEAGKTASSKGVGDARSNPKPSQNKPNPSNPTQQGNRTQNKSDNQGGNNPGKGGSGKTPGKSEGDSSGR